MKYGILSERNENEKEKWRFLGMNLMNHNPLVQFM